MPAAQPHDDIPSIGRFEVSRRIGKGSQGSVYLARDPNLDRRVAIKVIDSVVPELAADQSGSSPLEGRISSRLKHPNIVSIYDAGMCSSGTYMVFEYVEGTTLKEKIAAEGPMSIEAAAKIIATILDAVATAHRSQICHLDLNLRNILMDADGQPRIMDFGLSRHIDRTPRSESTATGTLRYMSPEHFNGKPLGAYTDVFALGSTFYEMVTGNHAMNGSSIVDVMRQIQQDEVDMQPVDQLANGAAFSEFLRGALHREIDGRYGDCAAMADAFSMFLDNSQIESDAPETSQATVEFLLRRMQRKQDFPSISKTLIDINKLTSIEASASADRLANVVLRDFALTNKILKLVNSAFYGNRSSEVSSISQAIVIMGVDRLRMVANSLTLFGHLTGGNVSTHLKDSMIRSLLAGMLARHLAKELKIRRAEEAFILGMFKPLGENLCIYYFNEEYLDILDAMQNRNLDKNAAARGVLGVSYANLGAAVARIWQMPEAIVEVINGLPEGPTQAPENDNDRLRDIAVFCAELCDLNDAGDPANQDIALNTLLSKYATSLPLKFSATKRLLAAGFERLREAADIFEIEPANSPYCADYQRWLNFVAPSEATVIQPKKPPAHH